jgi:hypothetical protein
MLFHYLFDSVAEAGNLHLGALRHLLSGSFRSESHNTTCLTFTIIRLLRFPRPRIDRDNSLFQVAVRGWKWRGDVSSAYLSLECGWDGTKTILLLISLRFTRIIFVP